MALIGKAMSVTRYLLVRNAGRLENHGGFLCALWWGGGFLLLSTLLSCGGPERQSGDQVGNLNQKFTISPANPVLYQGKAQQFLGHSPWGGSASWSVVPASAGVFSRDGLFTPTGANGHYTVVAMWKKDPRYTATTKLTLVDPPKAPVTDPDVVQASGVQQQVGSMQNSLLAGENVQIIVSQDASGRQKVRHGFAPPVN